MASATERDGIFWSLVSWGGGVVAFLFTYGIVRALFGGSAPDGLVFGSVVFMLVAGILTFRLGPDASESGHGEADRHDAHAAAPLGAAAASAPVVAPGPAKAERVPSGDERPSAAPDATDPVPEPATETSAAPVPAVETVEPVTAAPAAEPVDEPIAATSAEPAPVEEASSEVSAPASDVKDVRSERVSEAAREAGLLAAGLGEPAVEPKQPASLVGPRDGQPDDLKKIKGVGPKLEGLLHKLGYYHFDQIAAWTPEEIAWVDTNIEDFPGRATRDNWVGQARDLSGGGSTDFSQRVDRGEVY